MLTQKEKRGNMFLSSRFMAKGERIAVNAEKKLKQLSLAGGEQVFARIAKNKYGFFSFSNNK